MKGLPFFFSPIKKPIISRMAHCTNCKKTIDRIKDRDICPYCGKANPIEEDYATMDVTSILPSEEGDLVKSKSRKAFLLLCLFFGVFGAHRFYLRQCKRGFQYLVIDILCMGVLSGVSYLVFVYLLKMNNLLFLCILLPLLFWLISDLAMFIAYRRKDDLKDKDGVYLR